MGKIAQTQLIQKCRYVLGQNVIVCITPLFKNTDGNDEGKFILVPNISVQP